MRTKRLLGTLILAVCLVFSTVPGISIAKDIGVLKGIQRVAITV
jgi:hypothetical protein